MGNVLLSPFLYSYKFKQNMPLSDQRLDLYIRLLWSPVYVENAN